MLESLCICMSFSTGPVYLKISDPALWRLTMLMTLDSCLGPAFGMAMSKLKVYLRTCLPRLIIMILDNYLWISTLYYPQEYSVRRKTNYAELSWDTGLTLFVLGEYIRVLGSVTDDPLFIKLIFYFYSSPNGPSLVNWPVYDQSNKYMNLGLQQTEGQDLKMGKLHFFTVELPKKLAALHTA